MAGNKKNKSQQQQQGKKKNKNTLSKKDKIKKRKQEEAEHKKRHEEKKKESEEKKKNIEAQRALEKKLETLQGGKEQLTHWKNVSGFLESNTEKAVSKKNAISRWLPGEGQLTPDNKPLTKGTKEKVEKLFNNVLLKQADGMAEIYPKFKKALRQYETLINADTYLPKEVIQKNKELRGYETQFFEYNKHLQSSHIAILSLLENLSSALKLSLKEIYEKGDDIVKETIDILRCGDPDDTAIFKDAVKRTNNTGINLKEALYLVIENGRNALLEGRLGLVLDSILEKYKRIFGSEVVVEEKSRFLDDTKQSFEIELSRVGMVDGKEHNRFLKTIRGILGETGSIQYRSQSEDTDVIRHFYTVTGDMASYFALGVHDNTEYAKKTQGPILEKMTNMVPFLELELAKEFRVEDFSDKVEPFDLNHYVTFRLLMKNPSKEAVGTFSALLHPYGFKAEIEAEKELWITKIVDPSEKDGEIFKLNELSKALNQAVVDQFYNLLKDYAKERTGEEVVFSYKGKTLSPNTPKEQYIFTCENFNNSKAQLLSSGIQGVVFNNKMDTRCKLVPQAQNAGKSGIEFISVYSEKVVKVKITLWDVVKNFANGMWQVQKPSLALSEKPLSQEKNIRELGGKTVG